MVGIYNLEWLCCRYAAGNVVGFVVFSFSSYLDLVVKGRGAFWFNCSRFVLWNFGVRRAFPTSCAIMRGVLRVLCLRAGFCSKFHVVTSSKMRVAVVHVIHGPPCTRHVPVAEVMNVYDGGLCQTSCCFILHIFHSFELSSRRMEKYPCRL